MRDRNGSDVVTSGSMGTRRATPSRALSVVLLTFLFVVVGALPAFAVPRLPGPVDDVVDKVDEIASSDEPVSDAIDAVDDAIGGVTGTEDPIQGTVDDVTDAIDENAGTDVGGTVDGVVDKADDVVSDTGETVDGVVDRVDEATGGTIGDVIGGGEGAPGDNGGPADRRNPRGFFFGPEGSARANGSKRIDRGRGGAARPNALRPARPTGARATSEAVSPAVSRSAEPSLGERLREAAIEASKKLALPLALTIVVLGYVIAQYWADRRDPKLVLAPLDADHDLLSFQ